MKGVDKSFKQIGSYILERDIGEGEFSQVFFARSLNRLGEFAVKCLRKSKLAENPLYFQILKTEVEILRGVSHPNIVKLHEVFETQNCYYIVLDFCNRGDFEKFLADRKLKRLEENEAKNFMIQIKNAFAEMRKLQIIHRDFKMANLLVHNDEVRLSDFGMAKRGSDFAKTVVGSYFTMAPELLTSSGVTEYTSKADLWSVGFVFYQMLTGELPFFGLSPSEIYLDIKQKQNSLTFPPNLSPNSVDLVKKLLRADPNERIDWEKFFDHPFFQSSTHRTVHSARVRSYQSTSAPNLHAVNKTPTSTQNLNRFTFDSLADTSPKTATSSDKNSSNEALSPFTQDTFSSPLPSPSQNTINVPLLKSFSSIVQKSPQIPSKPIPPKLISIARRYSQERLKISFLIETAVALHSKLEGRFPESFKRCFAKIGSLLIKKAILICKVCHQSLLSCQNIFSIDHFTEFLVSELRPSLINRFDSDMKNLLSRFSSQIPNKFSLDQNILPSANSSLQTLDSELFSLVGQLKAFQLQLSEDMKRELQITLIGVMFCIRCEKMLGMENFEQKIDWSGFCSKFEKLSRANLEKTMNDTIV